MFWNLDSSNVSYSSVEQLAWNWLNAFMLLTPSEDAHTEIVVGTPASYAMPVMVLPEMVGSISYSTLVQYAAQALSVTEASISSCKYYYVLTIEYDKISRGISSGKYFFTWFNIKYTHRCRHCNTGHQWLWPQNKVKNCWCIYFHPFNMLLV